MADPKVKFKRSSVSGKRPTVDNVELGEIALNTYDGRLYTLQDTGGIGIGTTTTLLTPWQESYGGSGISYTGDLNVTGVTTITGSLNVTSFSTFNGNTKHADGKYANFGNDTDLQIVHDNSNAVIQNATGQFFIDNNASGGDILIRANDNILLRIDGNTTVLTAQTGGIDVTGHVETDTLQVSGVGTATSFDGNLTGFDELTAPHSSTTKNYSVTVSSKSDHRYQGTGSGSAYYIDGVESPILHLTPGRTYRFTLSSSDMSSHPFRFYLEADKTTSYTTNVTSTATYTEIVVTDETPAVIHYQCSSHGYMGNAVITHSNKVNTPYLITGLDGANITGVVTATSLVKSGGTSSQFLKADGSVDSSTYLTSYTETDPVVAAINGIVKSNGSTISAASAGTDYLAPTGDGSGLSGIATNIQAGANITVLESPAGNFIVTSTASGGDTVTINATATDILSVSSGDISADDAGADKLVFWDDSESKLTYLTAGSGLSISGTTITASGGGGGSVGVSSGGTEITSDTSSLNFIGTGLTITDDGSTTNIHIPTTSRTTTEYTATAGQTTFSGLTYTVGLVDVYLNGSKLDSTDFTATNGTSVVLTTGASVGDRVVVVSHTAFNITNDRIGISSAGTLIGNVNSLNFIGAGNTFALNGSTIDISIAGGGGGGGSVGVSSGGTEITSETSSLNFVGTGLTITDDGTTTNIYFPTTSRTTTEYIATAGQTTFSGLTYTVGFVDVFFNGSKLDSTEFTANNGTSVVLTTGASVGDRVVVVSNNNSYVVPSNAITKDVTKVTATGGQTVFNGTYTVGFVDVFLNGSKLDSTEFTANNGTSITLTTGATANDIIEIVGFRFTNGSTNIELSGDGSPELGGNLDIKGFNIIDSVGSGSITATVSGVVDALEIMLFT